MNYARIEKSKRLKRVLKLLSDGKEHSTLDIIKNAYVCAVNSIISELRRNGYAINCFRRNNKFIYQLVGKVGTN